MEVRPNGQTVICRKDIGTKENVKWRLESFWSFRFYKMTEGIIHEKKGLGIW